MRWIATEEFVTLIQSLKDKPTSMAVVGGGVNDPEVEHIIDTYPDIELVYFGIEDPGVKIFNFLDLNKDTKPLKTYDLVHCAHVFEHIWDVKQGVANLIALTKPNGIIWINCPASTQAHGSPEYYSAGYQPELISNLAVSLGARVVKTETLGCRRSYFYEHTLMRWPSRKEFMNPLIFSTEGRGGVVRAIFRWIKYFPQRLLASFFSKTVIKEPKYATQTIVVLTK